MLEALNKLYPSSLEENPVNEPLSSQNVFFDRPFDLCEFTTALHNKNTKSSPGMDGIDYFILTKLSIQYKLLLLDIFNALHSNQSYPPSWKSSYIHFISKSGGKSLRPIALTSCLGKLFETLI